MSAPYTPHWTEREIEETYDKNCHHAKTCGLDFCLGIEECGDAMRRERQILFSAPMVRGLLGGTKTQTRRVVKPMRGKQAEWLTLEGIQQVPHGEMIAGGWQMHHPKAGTDHMGVFVACDSPVGWISCPYGQPGERLWVRESAWIAPPNFGNSSNSDLIDPEGRRRVVGYSASMDSESIRCARDYGVKQTPSIHMPRWASRIALEVTGVRVERLQAISVEDAIAEGITHRTMNDPRVEYRWLWEEINGPGSWDANPWVWVIEFRRIKP